MVITQELYHKILNSIESTPDKEQIYNQAIQDRLSTLSEQFNAEINQTFESIITYLNNDSKFSKYHSCNALKRVSVSLKKAINYHNRFNNYTYDLFIALCELYTKL